MLEKFPKTVSLLIDLTFNYEYWHSIPESFKWNIYSEFVRESSTSSFINYISDLFIQEDYSILLLSEFKGEACKKFSEDRISFLKLKCNSDISELFDKVKQHFIDAKFLKNEMKDENKLKEKFNLT